MAGGLRHTAQSQQPVQILFSREPTDEQQRLMTRADFGLRRRPEQAGVEDRTLVNMRSSAIPSFRRYSLFGDAVNVRRVEVAYVITFDRLPRAVAASIENIRFRPQDHGDPVHTPPEPRRPGGRVEPGPLMITHEGRTRPSARHTHRAMATWLTDSYEPSCATRWDTGHLPRDCAGADARCCSGGVKHGKIDTSPGHRFEKEVLVMNPVIVDHGDIVMPGQRAVAKSSWGWCCGNGGKQTRRISGDGEFAGAVLHIGGKLREKTGI